jgi:hypothetical protein
MEALNESIDDGWRRDLRHRFSSTSRIWRLFWMKFDTLFLSFWFPVSSLFLCSLFVELQNARAHVRAAARMAAWRVGSWI